MLFDDIKRAKYCFNIVEKTWCGTFCKKLVDDR